MVFSEIKIKNKILKNRLIIPPMALRKASDEGFVTEELLEYYHNITSDKNMALVIVEHAYVDIKGKAHINQLGIDNSNKIEGLSHLTKVIHDNDTLCIAQISHAGQATTSFDTGYPTVGVSDVAFGKRNSPDETLNKEEIEKIIDYFARSALIAKESGFDGVEIHSAHGYLLNQFYSKYTNRRNDEYGGSISNRLNIHKEIVRAIRKNVGNDFLVFIRLGLIDYNMEGNDETDAINAINILKDEEIDAFDISGGLTGYMAKAQSSDAGYFKEITEKVKEITSIPVILTGGVTKLEEARCLLNNKKADIIGVGRSVFYNNHWLKEELEKENLK